MELITSSALSAGADADTARQILSCVTTEEAVNVLKKAGLCEKTMELIMQKIMFYQLKTPLAALMMYQEIIEAEPDNTETVKKILQGRKSCLRD